MVSHHSEQSTEVKLTFPKFVVRSSGSNPSKNEVKVYYSKDIMLQDVMGMWGSVDIAVQLFVKQKHLSRGAAILRYHANRSGHVHKATVLTNTHPTGKQGGLDPFYKGLVPILNEYKLR